MYVDICPIMNSQGPEHYGKGYEMILNENRVGKKLTYM